jgi:glycerate-2-kinase
LEAVKPTQTLQQHVQVDLVEDEVPLGNDDDDDQDNTATTTKRGGVPLLRIGTTQTYNLQDYHRIVILGFGKAASPMTAALVQTLQPHVNATSTILTGVCITKDGHVTDHEQQILTQNNIQIYEASHPIPDTRSVQATQQLCQVVQHATTSSDDGNTLVLTCISGGGSALLTCPISPLTLEDLQATNQALLETGWPIEAMNVIRQQLDACKGGKLLQFVTHPHTTTWVNLVLSDIIGDPLSLIASGPSVPSSTTISPWKTVQQLLQELPPLLSHLPQSVQDFIQQGIDNADKDQDDKTENNNNNSNTLKKVSSGGGGSGSKDVQPYTHIVGNTKQAVEAAAATAQQLGYTPLILATQLQGEARELASFFVAMAQHYAMTMATTTGTTSTAPPGPIAILTGGESTVTLSSSSSPSSSTKIGKGGRNQEMALAVALGLEETWRRDDTHQLPTIPVLFASVGTDGTDGPTDAAGAIVTPTTITKLGRSAGLQALQTHNAYPYLSQSYAVEDDTIMNESSSNTTTTTTTPILKTGPTGTNVADIQILLIGTPESLAKSSDQ